MRPQSHHIGIRSRRKMHFTHIQVKIFNCAWLQVYSCMYFEKFFASQTHRWYNFIQFRRDWLSANSLLLSHVAKGAERELISALASEFLNSAAAAAGAGRASDECAPPAARTIQSADILIGKSAVKCVHSINAARESQTDAPTVSCVDQSLEIYITQQHSVSPNRTERTTLFFNFPTCMGALYKSPRQKQSTISINIK